MRGSPEPGADLISWGQLFVKHIWQRAGPHPADCPPPPPSLALPSRNAGSASRIWSVFLGQPAPPPAPGPGLGVGATPPGFPGSSLLLPVWLPGRPATGPRDRKGSGRDVAFFLGGVRDLRASCLAPTC